jgi:aminopeptidase N
MLRNYLGDSAFFKSLNKYLTENRFKSAEAHQLRLAFEEISGKDLNWFFNQWYFGSGHPKLEITYSYNDAAGTATVYVKQTQEGEKPFQLPMAIDVYEGGKKNRYQVVVKNRIDSFQFSYKKRPDLINVDADKVMLAEKKDNKTAEQFAFQYKNAGNYLDRREAIEYAAEQQADGSAQAILMQALKDPYHGLRSLALQSLDLKNSTTKNAAEKTIAELAAKDPKSTVRAKAIELLAGYNNNAYTNIFKAGLNDSSYAVAGASLSAIMEKDNTVAVEAARKMLAQPIKGSLIPAITNIAAKNNLAEATAPINEAFGRMPLSQEKLELLGPFAKLLANSTDASQVKAGVSHIVKFREGIPAQYRTQIDPYINNMILQSIQQAWQKKTSAEAKEVVEFITAARSGEKKGF